MAVFIADRERLRCLALLGIVCFAINAYAFDASSTIPSIFRGIVTRIDLVSATNTDSFSKLDISGTIATELRLLEAPQIVNKSAVDAYVEDRYPLLPKEHKAALKDFLFEAKKYDQVLKGRMNSPSLTDEMKVGFGKERERLLFRVRDFENDFANRYFESVKPQAMGVAKAAMIEIRYYEEEAILCTIESWRCDRIPERILKLDPKNAFNAVQIAAKEVAGQAVNAPAEVHSIKSENVDFATLTSFRSLTVYLRSLKANE